MLGNVYEIVCEAKIMYGVEVWGLSEAWKCLDKAHCRLFQKVMGVPNCASTGLAETELWRGNRRGKTVKYWIRIMCLDVEFR
jgi:hypothetical protein